MAVGMDNAWMNGMMVIKEILAMMNKGGRSQGKVHYARIEVFTVFLSIIVCLVVPLSSRCFDYRRCERTYSVIFKGQGV
jgi:hypothetical protein